MLLDYRMVECALHDGTVVQFSLHSDHVGYWAEVLLPGAQPIVLDQWDEVLDIGAHCFVIVWA